VACVELALTQCLAEQAPQIPLAGLARSKWLSRPGPYRFFERPFLRLKARFTYVGSG
jgi:hypothetical protein